MSEYANKHPLVYNRFGFSLNKHKKVPRQAKLRCHIAALTFSSVQVEASCRSASYRQRGNDIVRGWITPALWLWWLLLRTRRVAVTHCSWPDIHHVCRRSNKPSGETCMRRNNVIWTTNVLSTLALYLGSKLLQPSAFCYLASRGHKIWLQKTKKMNGCWDGKKKFNSNLYKLVLFLILILKINHCSKDKTSQPMGEVTTLLLTQSIHRQNWWASVLPMTQLMLHC